MIKFEPSDLDLPDILMGKVQLCSEKGCWLWIKELNRNGYGTFRTHYKGKRKRNMAHITTYVLVKGEYDRSLLLDHLCRVRNCCNPRHLEPVTVKVNTERGNAVLFRPADER